MLDFKDDRFDLIIHFMALHSANDVPGQLIQSRLALHPDGLFLGVFLGGESLHELRTSFAAGETYIENGISPRVAPMVDVRSAGQLMSRAGLALQVSDIVPLSTSYASPLALMHELRGFGLTNPLSAQRKFLRRDTLGAVMSHYVDHFPDDPDPSRIRAQFDLIFVSGWAPAANQPKPLRPGSAKISLADALDPKSKIGNPNDNQ